MGIMVKLQGLMCDETEGCRPFCYRGRGISAEYVRFETGRSERERRRETEVCKALADLQSVFTEERYVRMKSTGGFVVALPKTAF